jgi:hypothetical protein
LLPEQRHNGSLEANHRTNECIDDHQQRELLPVRTQTKTD